MGEGGDPRPRTAGPEFAPGCELGSPAQTTCFLSRRAVLQMSVPRFSLLQVAPRSGPVAGAARAGKTGSWDGAAGRETPAHTPGSGGTTVTPLGRAAPRGRGRERAGESGWAVPWRGGVIWTSANHRRLRGAGQRRCLGNTLPAWVLRTRPLRLPRIRGPSRGVTSVPLGVSSHDLVSSRLGVSYFSSLFLGPLLSNTYTGFLFFFVSG